MMVLPVSVNVLVAEVGFLGDSFADDARHSPLHFDGLVHVERLLDSAVLDALLWDLHNALLLVERGNGDHAADFAELVLALAWGPHGHFVALVHHLCRLLYRALAPGLRNEDSNHVAPTAFLATAFALLVTGISRRGGCCTCLRLESAAVFGGL